MTAARKAISFGQQIAIDRRHNAYVYGGNWDPFDRSHGAGTDCSGCIVDMLDAAINGAGMAWTRHGLSTEDWRPPSMGGGADPKNGPFGTVMVNDPSQFPANAAVLIAFHHGPGGGANSHTWCQVDKLKIETHGSDGTYPDGATVLNDGVNFDDDVLDVHTIDSGSTYGANNWWYLPGPIVEDGTPIPTAPSGSGGAAPAVPVAPAGGAAPDTLWADVSEFQAPANPSYWAATYSDQGSSYPYRWLSIRSNDGDHVDANFAPNYAECVRACNAGQADGFFVYYYWRPGSDAVNTHISLVEGRGGPHPKMVSMMDVESGDGNPTVDESSSLNSDYAALAQWLGDQRRVVGYANTSDEKTLWQTKPIPNTPFILAGYGANPADSSVYKFAHQYTDGEGYGGGLPEGAPPFGNCDMNSADGLSSQQLAAILGVGAASPAPVPAPTPPTPAPAPDPVPFMVGWTDRQVMEFIATQLVGPNGQGYPQLGTNAAGQDLTLVDGVAAARADIKELLPAPTPPASK